MKYALLLLLIGCGKKAEPQVTTSPAPEPSEYPREIAAWMTPDLAKAWEGSFVTTLALGDPLATPDPAVLDVKDGGAKGFNGKEYALGFSILAPCMANFEQVALEKDAISASTRKYFVVDKGVLIASDAGVGMRKGKAAIVCDIDVVTVDDKGACVTWQVLENWKHAPVECAWKKTEDGADVLAVGKYAEYLAQGDILVSMPAKLQIEHKTHQRYPSYDAAKQAFTSHK